MKLAAIVVTYHPNLHELQYNLATYACDVDLLILWDNSEFHVDYSIFLQLYPNLILHQDNQNVGLPIAYNHAIQEAKKQGCSHLMTMDQDSAFSNFASYRSWLEKKQLKCISCVSINNNSQAEEETMTGTACQSSSVFPITLFDRIGGFRDDLFIGMVDAEICLRAHENGYRVIQYNRCNLVHRVGSGRQINLLGKYISVSDYNALRHYYDSRNRILLWYEFPNDYALAGKIKHISGRLKVLVKVLLFEKNKWAKISAIVRGTYYGFLNQPKPF